LSSVIGIELPSIGNPIFSPKSESSLEGIIAYLTAQRGGNVHDLGIVEIEASSRDSPLFEKYTADLRSPIYFQSNNKADQWLMYDFKNLRVKPTHYSIHAHSNNYYLRSWVLEGSLDKSEWIELDHQENNTTTSSAHPIGTFPISSSVECRYVRLRQTGKNARGTDHLILFAFEIFGQLHSIRNQ
jgi:hypothetical protein